MQYILRTCKPFWNILTVYMQKKKTFKIFFLSLFFAPVFFQMPALINNFISDKEINMWVCN